MKKSSVRICKAGHQYVKNSDCPTCPICEQERKPQAGFLSLLAAPARRALENNGIQTLEQLAKQSEIEILELHGIGPSSLIELHKALQLKGLSFREG